jgi:hypothetical protein
MYHGKKWPSAARLPCLALAVDASKMLELVRTGIPYEHTAGGWEVTDRASTQLEAAFAADPKRASRTGEGGQKYEDDLT